MAQYLDQWRARAVAWTMHGSFHDKDPALVVLAHLTDDQKLPRHY
ncbi:MAG: hypothetical protein ACR2OA_01185 [Rubripirellula sp.]